MRSVVLSVALIAAVLAGDMIGERPYEMVRTGRKPPHPPLVGFDALEGWQAEGANGGRAELAVTQEQRVWESPAARLVYRGSSRESEISIRPPGPIPIPEPYSAVTLWVYGNNWGWEPDPSTPQVQLMLLLRDKDGATVPLELDSVRWKEWWLIHRVVPNEILGRKPLSFAGFLLKGCANTEDRRLYFEDLAFYQENPKPLAFKPRPSRPIAPFPGQNHGANTGSGRLPFPTREETILPENSTADFKTGIIPAADGFVLRYAGADASIEYLLSRKTPFFGGIEARMNGRRVATLWSEAGPDFGEQPARIDLVRFGQSGDSVEGVWKVVLAGKTVDVSMAARIWQKSLVLDVLCPDGTARELSYGWIHEAAEPELILLPFLNYGGHHLHVLMSRGPVPFFASVWMDWYRSNASAPYAVDKIEDGRVRLNGGVRYIPKTDGARNGLFERVFLTIAPQFEETLPAVANPPARNGKEAGTRLWQESWGPDDYRKEHERSARLRAYGIEKLTQCNHEITWRDGGESFTFRTVAAPGKGGDKELRNYVAAQKSLGWRSGLYTNYCDFAPVNQYWDPDMVMRNSSGDLVRAWPRCYSPKALFAVEMDRKLAPEIVRKFKPDAAYTDVHTSVSPWERCDYDARVPGAGTFAATYYAYGEILLHDQEVYKNHCWSEGHHQWLYAGLTTGNYGLTYSDLKLWQYPYLPHFDLLKMHPLTVDIGVPWTAQFFTGKEGWDQPGEIVRSIDRFIAATIAYGHMGWLVEEKHGIRQTCRSYYMLQQLQSRYLMERVSAIKYGTDQGLASSSSAFLDGSWKDGRLHIAYANGLQVFLNGNEEKHWTLEWRGRNHTLPPFGWLAVLGDEFFTASSLVDGKRIDRLSSPEYVFLDGRGSYAELDGIGTSGSVAVLGRKNASGLTVFAVEGVESLTVSAGTVPRPAGDVRAKISELADSRSISVQAVDIDGKIVGHHKVDRPSGAGPVKWPIPVVHGAVRYEVVPGQ
jgi:hypothetical protein